MMKKLSKKFQKGGFWEKLFLFTVTTLLVVATWFLVDSVMFFLQTVLTFWGLVLLAPIVALGIIAFSILKYPRVKDINDYSEPVRKYL
ncbi:hypothetical protein qdsa001_46 [Staphylococcus phage qdsa001]|nr:putative membrane protein [Staphylococcus phage StAP1]ARQ95802.1 hypothetical protein qdsa001_46 [Staphylococcus phage qdsa001]QQO38175.1 hypothetical protein LSA2308_00155 [Staphylococcus phage LSA2308]QYC52112.1 hypothetical protein RP15_gp168 [Staphylococcus phage vB_Sau-RP15]UGL60663.1 putative membrane protein [Staphylococcus phage vB_SauM-HM01]UVD42443.1 hypothetical protein [Staphylococcus phage vB_SauM-V1SA19]UVD42667.1 hypothetical protein [Staphylococcus phage vB_SauM-V1SA22]UVT